MDKADRDCLRFLWVNNAHDKQINPAEYRFCTVVFGVSSSPLLLNATLQHHLGRYVEENPEFVTEMTDSFYVDDFVAGEQMDNQVLAIYECASTRS